MLVRYDRQAGSARLAARGVRAREPRSYKKRAAVSLGGARAVAAPRGSPPPILLAIGVSAHSVGRVREAQTQRAGRTALAIRVLSARAFRAPPTRAALAPVFCRHVDGGRSWRLSGGVGAACRWEGGLRAAGKPGEGESPSAALVFSLSTLETAHSLTAPKPPPHRHRAHTTSPSILASFPLTMPLGGDPPPDPGGAPPPPPLDDSSGGPPPLPRFAKRRRSTPTASFVAALSSVPGGERDALAGVAAALASREAAVAAAEAALAARAAALERAEAALVERNAALSTAEAALAVRASAGAAAAAVLTAARATDPPTSGDGSGCLDSLADAAVGASDGGGGGSRNGATESKPPPPQPHTILPSPPALQLLASAPPPVSLPQPPPPVAVPRPTMAPAHHPATPTAPGAELSKKLDAKSCDHILCLTKEMARELLPPVPAAWGGGPVQLSVEVVDDAGAVWPMTYRCVPSRYSYELRAGWKQFAAAARVGVGDVVHLSRVDAPPPRTGAARAVAAGGDAPRIRLRLERAPRPPPPPPGRRVGGGGGGVRSVPPPPPPRGFSLLAAVARAAEAESAATPPVATPPPAPEGAVCAAPVRSVVAVPLPGEGGATDAVAPAAQ